MPSQEPIPGTVVLMDPSSIAAGTIAFASAAIATGKYPKKLLALRNAPVELYQLHNEPHMFILDMELRSGVFQASS